MTSCVLQRVAPPDFSPNPFPHLIVRNALPRELFNSLMETFPAVEVVNIKNRPLVNNNDCFLGAIDVVHNNAIAENWRHFFAHHTSSQFSQEAVKVIAEPFRQL